MVTYKRWSQPKVQLYTEVFGPTLGSYIGRKVIYKSCNSSHVLCDVSIVVLCYRLYGRKVMFHQELVIIVCHCILVHKQTD